MDILEEVKRVQKECGLTDSQMAEHLGYNQRENWVRIKHGRAPVTDRFIGRVAIAFPALTATLSKTSQDGKRGGVKGLLDKIVLRVKKFV